MLTLAARPHFRDCEGSSRRDFLKVGVLGLGGLTLSELLRIKVDAATQGRSLQDKSVIWIWLAGGPTHVETFDPKMTAPSEYRSLTGEVKTPIPGVTLGGGFPHLAAAADKMALVRSFAHGNSSHGTATQLVMTGYTPQDKVVTRPGAGAIVSRVNGSSNPQTGMPTYVRLGKIRGDGPGFLGTAASPFDPAGQAGRDMQLSLSEERLSTRRKLLNGLDRINRHMDRSGTMTGLDGLEQQAFELILGQAAVAFDVRKEDPKTLARYGKGLGEQLLKARRLCETGCSFVTVSYGGWDMHGGILKGLKTRGPQVDQAVSTLVNDLADRGMHERTLVVVTGEFGRTPRINKKGGRDHWSNLCTLALSGGGLKMGQVVGRSAPKVDVPDSTPIHPQDLIATILKMFGIDPRIQIIDTSGRPTYLVEHGQPIAELI